MAGRYSLFYNTNVINQHNANDINQYNTSGINQYSTNDIDNTISTISTDTILVI